MDYFILYAALGVLLVTLLAMNIIGNAIGHECVHDTN